MTRLFFCIFAILAPVWVSSFCPDPVSPSRNRFSARLASTEAEDRLDKVTQSWNDLLQREVDVNKKDETAAPNDIAQEMMEKGLELVRARKAVEMERVASARESLTEIDTRLRQVSEELKEAKKHEANAKQALKKLERNEEELEAALEQLKSNK